MVGILTVVLTILVVSVMAVIIYKSKILSADTRQGSVSIAYTTAGILISAGAIATAFTVVGTEMIMLIVLSTAISSIFIFPFIVEKFWGERNDK